MMKISSCTGNLIKDIPSAQKWFPVFREAGFDALDLSLFMANFSHADVYAHRPSAYFNLPTEQRRAMTVEIARIARENGLQIGQTHAPFPSQILTGDEEWNRVIDSAVEKSIEATAWLDCPYIVIHPVFTAFSKNHTTEDQYRINREFYGRFIPVLKCCGVTACLENMWFSKNGKIYAACCTDFREVNRLIRDLNEMAGAECFAFCLDTGHATLCSQDLSVAIRTLGSNIRTLHLHDVHPNDDSHTAPYFGVADWDEILTSLQEIGYSGTLNFEAAETWEKRPEALTPSFIRLLGDCGKYFRDTYF